MLHRNGQTQDAAVTSRIEANSPSMPLRLAAPGLGIALVDEALTHPLPEADQLRPVLEDWLLSPIPISAVTASRIQPLKTRRLIDHLALAFRRFDQSPLPLAAPPA